MNEYTPNSLGASVMVSYSLPPKVQVFQDPAELMGWSLSSASADQLMQHLELKQFDFTWNLALLDRLKRLHEKVNATAVAKAMT